MREATDLGVSAGVRRELTGRRIDLTKLKFPVKNGVITIQGELEFVGMEKTNDETAIELKFIESSLKNLKGAKEVHFELSNWAKNDAGVWENKESKDKTGSAPIATGEGIKCPDCDYVIRYCPCCGKPLAGGSRKHSPSKTKRSRPPVKPIARKKRPLGVGPVAAHKPEPQQPQDKPAAEQEDKTKEIKSTPGTQAKPETPGVKTPETIVPTQTPTSPEKKEETHKEAAPKPLPPLKPLGEKAQPEPVESDASQPPATPSAPAEPPIPQATPEQQAPQQQPPAPPEQEQVPDLGDLDLSDFALNEGNNQQSSQPPAATPKEPAAPQSAPEPPAQTPPAPASPVPTSPQPEQPPVAEQPPEKVEPVSSAPQTPPQQPQAPQAQKPAAFEDFDLNLDDTPLPPLKEQSNEPQAFDENPDFPPTKPAEPQPEAPSQAQPPATPPEKPEISGYMDDDTPLPPLKPKEPEQPSQPQEQPANKDPFAALFSDSAANNNQNQGDQSQQKDPFASLDLNLDVLEVFPSDGADSTKDTEQKPPAQPDQNKPAQPSQGNQDHNPFDIDNVFDLDSPIEGESKDGKKEKDPFDLDDFDISKFKI